MPSSILLVSVVSATPYYSLGCKHPDVGCGIGTSDRAGVLVGSILHWGVLRKLFPETGAIADYVARCAARPALKRAMEIEEGYVKAQEAASA
jgi:hypothetical protein